MKITAVETIRLTEFANLLWVRIHTDEGLVGLGETYLGAAAVEAYVHDWIAPKVLGQDPLQIEARNRDVTGYLGWRSAGVETRGNSALDIALWDLFGKACGQPVWQMLGGRSRDRIRIYNTCAGYKYIRDARAQAVANWGTGAAEGPYEDLDAFLHRADELAVSLLEQGITGMKIWPFDPAAERTQRPRHQRRRAAGGARAVSQDPQGRRLEDGHHGRVPLAVAPAGGAAHRPRARGVRHVLARGSDPPGFARPPEAVRAAFEGADLCVARRSRTSPASRTTCRPAWPAS